MRGRNPYSIVPAADDEGFAGSQLRQHRDILREQDTHIDILGATVSRIGQLAAEIGQEVETQNFMIDELEEDLDKVITYHILGMEVPLRIHCSGTNEHRTGYKANKEAC
jgi:hypothetical protein